MADLVRRRVAVISTAGSHPAALAAKAATTTIPIVFSVANESSSAWSCCQPRPSPQTHIRPVLYWPQTVIGATRTGPKESHPMRKDTLLITVITFGLTLAGIASAEDQPISEQIVDVMNKVFGVHPGFRANHAKGIV